MSEEKHSSNKLDIEEASRISSADATAIKETYKQISEDQGLDHGMLLYHLSHDCII
jgi:hypothetical protein